MYDSAMEYMGTIVRFSINESFAGNYFYRELKPQLQKQLVNEVLGDVIERFRFFFNDYFNKWHCPSKLVQKLVPQLKSKMHERGNTIVKTGENMTSLIFFYSGSAHLFGSYEWKGERMYFEAVTLKGGSWFGDYQAMLNVKSDWDLIAGGHKDGQEDGKRARGMPPNHIMTYELDSEYFRKACDVYPVFRSQLISRALVRRSYFQKTFNDNVQVLLLRQKQHEHKKKLEHVRLSEGKEIENDYYIDP